MKKLLSLALCLMLALALVGGAAAEGDKTPVTLSLWVWDDAQVPPTQKMVDAFSEEYPWITVEITSIAGVTDYNMKMQSVIGTADAPSVFWMNFNLSREYVPMGFVQDLTDYISADESFDLSALNAGITEAYTVDGRHYAVPKDTDSFAVFYNKALFDAAGVAYPESDWTIADFAEAAKNVTTDTVKGWTNATSDRAWYNFIWANGGEIYSEDGMETVINAPEAVEAAQILMDMMNDGYAYNGIQLAEIDVMSSFSSQIAAMTMDGSWMISQYAEALGENLGIVEVPSGKAGKGSAGHGIGYSTTTSNPHMEETWLLLSFLGSDKAQEMQVEVVIPAANAAASVWEDVYPDQNLKAFVNALEYSRPIPLAAKNPTLARTAFQEIVGNILSGMYPDAQAAMDDAKAVMDEAIAS
jgi:multiple sugar transport system substrate-binding protein